MQRRSLLGEESKRVDEGKHGFFTSLSVASVVAIIRKRRCTFANSASVHWKSDYDYDLIKTVLTRDKIQSRPTNMWRYRELLPIEGEPTIGFQVGFTPSSRRIAWRNGWACARSG